MASGAYAPRSLGGRDLGPWTKGSTRAHLTCTHRWRAAAVSGRGSREPRRSRGWMERQLCRPESFAARRPRGRVGGRVREPAPQTPGRRSGSRRMASRRERSGGATRGAAPPEVRTRESAAGVVDAAQASRKTAGGCLRVSFEEGRGVVRIEVSDTRPALPARKGPGADEGGDAGWSSSTRLPAFGAYATARAPARTYGPSARRRPGASRAPWRFARGCRWKGGRPE